MNDRTVGFIGGGRIARIFLEGWKRAGQKLMKMPVKMVLVAALLFVGDAGALAGDGIQATNSPGKTKTTAKAKLPRLVDLGADKCIPCKKMAPLLKELKTDYAGQLEVEFIDVWKNPDAAKPYKILLIPTQIFYDAEGKERFRHEGFYCKEDILTKWKELGVNLKNPKS